MIHRSRKVIVCLTMEDDGYISELGFIDGYYIDKEYDLVRNDLCFKNIISKDHKSYPLSKAIKKLLSKLEFIQDCFCHKRKGA